MVGDMDIKEAKIYLLAQLGRARQDDGRPADIEAILAIIDEIERLRPAPVGRWLTCDCPDGVATMCRAAHSTTVSSQGRCRIWVKS